MQSKKCCLIINNHNNEKYLEETICSALNQTVGKDIYDVIFVDAGSTDKSRKIYQKYHKKNNNTYLFFIEKLNQAKTINAAIRAFPNYKYYSWINSDDIYFPSFIETHLKTLENNFNFDFCHSKAIFFEDEFNAFAWGGWDVFKGINQLNKNYVCQPSVMVRKEVFEKLQYFDESYVFAFDFEFWSRLINQNEINIAFIPNFTVMYRVRKDNMTNTFTDLIEIEHTKIIETYKTKKRKKKIVFTFDYIQISDSFYYEQEDSLTYAMEMLSKEYEVYAFCRSYNPGWEKIERNRGVIYSFSQKVENLIHQIKELQPDFLIFIGFETHMNLEISKILPNIPKILTFVGGVLRFPEDLKINKNSFVGLMVSSGVQKEELIKKGVSENLIFINSYAVDINLFKNIKKRKKEYDIIYCSDWRENKRQELLLKALVVLKNKGKKYKVLFLGAQDSLHNKEYYEKMQKFIIDQNLENIYCLNRVTGKETVKYYQKAKIGIHLGLITEGGARSPLEAMACGLPIIITTDCISNISRITNNKEGIYADPSVQDIANKIEYLLGNQELIINLGKHAEKKIKENYTYPIFCNKLISRIKEGLSPPLKVKKKIDNSFLSKVQIYRNL